MLQKAIKLVERAIFKNLIGSIEKLDNIIELENILNITLPSPLKELYLNVPIVGLETYYHKRKPKEEWIYYPMGWMNMSQIIGEMIETETGIEMKTKKFLSIGMDLSGGGDYYYIDLTHKNLPLYQCFHDDMSLELIADSLEDVFEFALVD